MSKILYRVSSLEKYQKKIDKVLEEMMKDEGARFDELKEDLNKGEFDDNYYLLYTCFKEQMLHSAMILSNQVNERVINYINELDKLTYLEDKK